MYRGWVAAAAVTGVVCVLGCGQGGMSRRRPVDLRVAQVADVSIDLRRSLAEPVRLRSHGLSFPSGWTRAGSWGLWAVGDRAVAAVLLPDRRDRVLCLDGRAYPGLPRGVGQRMTVSVNGQRTGAFAVGRRWEILEVPIPAAVQRIGANRVVLGFDEGVSPRAAGRRGDPRPHAYGFRSLELRAADGSSRGGVTVTDHVAPAGDDAGAVVRLDRSAIVVAPLLLDRHDTAFELRVARAGRGSAEPVAVRVVAWPGYGGELRPEAVVLGPGESAAERRWPVSGIGAGVTVAALKVDAMARVELSVAVLSGPAAPSPDEASAANPKSGARPDIVVVVLDAARPDRFGCYGGERPTTPNIDRLARGSAVFSRAFALAPYTLCSVPTMLTGTSFLRHGVVAKGDRLREDAVTLAEALREAGYRTAAFSATPNNSRSKGFDQGFEVFSESWREHADTAGALDPFPLVRRAAAWLEAQDGEAPVFLLVHMVPPHEPYAPGARFDLFSDPGYVGPVDGGWTTLRAFNRGAVRFDAEDLRHVGDLYDGNLRRADAAFGQLLLSLESRPRWADTAVLVTSDHGEALGEHGRIGHNSTVYDEMLAVPFVLRLPAGVAPVGIDTGGLTTLADLAPTLAGIAGVELPSAADGVDLVDHDSEDPNRWFLARNSHDPPVLGFRSARWKAVLSPYNIGELYDLVADPGETRDLMLERFELFTGLELLAFRALRASAGVPAKAEVDASDREMLRELGYLE